ncbi:DUF6924 domain-containing protein [Catellatospora aurea]|uniref:DUF6924 domain-containing protein n=1 Tax=Catellatospora aurea TaxID=1337874 RepID=A0ABW2GUJ0_9ACTN
MTPLPQPDDLTSLVLRTDIANMDFAEFADATDDSGTYRGFADD